MKCQEGMDPEYTCESRESCEDPGGSGKDDGERRYDGAHGEGEDGV